MSTALAPLPSLDHPAVEAPMVYKSLQDLFDIGACHLMRQGVRALKVSPIGRSQCVYRADDGYKCAVGAMIHDFAYDEKMEGQSAVTLCGEFSSAMQFSGINTKDVRTIELLDRLQVIHDSRPYVSWAADLLNVAWLCDLVVPSCLRIPGWQTLVPLAPLTAANRRS